MSHLEEDYLEEINKEPQEFETTGSLIASYKDVVFRSVVTSFGLDMLLFRDRRGGEVDTIHTVRDSTVKDYANSANQKAYDKRGEYDSGAYHGHANYTSKANDTKQVQMSGNLIDGYTGKRMDPNKSGDLDHIVAAKTVFDDPGRVLAGISGEDLANMEVNLVKTHSSVNRSKGQKDPVEYANYLDQNKESRRQTIKELKTRQKAGTFAKEDQQELIKLEQLDLVDSDEMRRKGIEAKKAQDQHINRTYYTSKKFFSESALATANMGFKMGIREATGLIIMDTWVIVAEEFPLMAADMKDDFSLEGFLNGMKELFKSAYERVRDHWKDYIKSFKQGVLAGVLAQITSIISNLFKTTFATAGRIIRQSWASIIEAVKILVYNPDRLPYGEVLRSIFKIVATVAAVTAGSLLQEVIAKHIGFLPAMLQEVIPAFTGALMSGLLSVSLLYFFDHSKQVQKLVNFANQIKDELDIKLDYYTQVVHRLTEFVAQLESMDYEKLEKEVCHVSDLFEALSKAKNIEEENEIFREKLKIIKIDMPYTTNEERDAFMMDKSLTLTI